MRTPSSLAPIAHRIRKRVGLLPSALEAADEVREVSPLEIVAEPRPFSLPGQLERVKGVASETKLSCELERASSVRVEHAPTLAMRFARATLIDGVVYANGARVQLVDRRERLVPRSLRDAPELTQVALPSSVVGDRYFAHFIIEDASAALMGRELATPYFAGGTRPRSAHERRYLELYGLDDIPELRTARLRDVWVFQDYAMTAHKRARMARMRARVRALPGTRSDHGVFFRRRGAGVDRGLANEVAIEERLAREGFEIIDVTREDVDGIVRRARDASVVCGVEGSALTHGILCMRQGGAVVTIQPPYRFNLGQRDYCHALGMRFGYVVGEGTSTQFEVSEDELMRTLDLAWARASQGGEHSEPALESAPAPHARAA